MNEIRRNGFTLLEIALVLTIVGVLAGGGVLVVGRLAKYEKRKAAEEQLYRAKQAMLVYAEVRGKLYPPGGTNGLPMSYGVETVDPWGQPLRYAVGAEVSNNTPVSEVCEFIYVNWLTGHSVKDVEAGQTFSVVQAVLVSAGAKDADADGSVFDATDSGSNNTGAPYVKARESETFDDLTVYVTVTELLEAMNRGGHCIKKVTIINNHGSTVWVYDITKRRDVAVVGISPNNVIEVQLDLLDSIEIRNAPAPSVPGSGGGTALTAAQPVTYWGNTIVVP